MQNKYHARPHSVPSHGVLEYKGSNSALPLAGRTVEQGLKKLSKGTAKLSEILPQEHMTKVFCHNLKLLWCCLAWMSGEKKTQSGNSSTCGLNVGYSN